MPVGRGQKRFQASKPVQSSMAETLQNLEQYSGQMTAKELEEVWKKCLNVQSNVSISTGMLEQGEYHSTNLLLVSNSVGLHNRAISFSGSRSHVEEPERKTGQKGWETFRTSCLLVHSLLIPCFFFKMSVF